MSVGLILFQRLLLCFLITLQRYGLYFENASENQIIFAKYAAKHII